MSGEEIQSSVVVDPIASRRSAGRRQWFKGVMMMGRARGVVVAGVVAAAILGMAGSADAAGSNGRSYCSGSSAPDGVVNPEDPTTWNSPGEIVSFLAPDQVVAGGPESVGAVAAFCNPNIFSPPAP